MKTGATCRNEFIASIKMMGYKSTISTSLFRLPGVAVIEVKQEIALVWKTDNSPQKVLPLSIKKLLEYLEDD